MHRAVRAFGRSPRRDGREPVALFRREVGRVTAEQRQACVGAVDRHDPIGIVEREVAADVAADVAAGRAERLVAERGHEFGPQSGDRDRIDGRPDGRVGVSVARHVGHDHVKGVGRVGAVRARDR